MFDAEHYALADTLNTQATGRAGGEPLHCTVQSTTYNCEPVGATVLGRLMYDADTFRISRQLHQIGRDLSGV